MKNLLELKRELAKNSQALTTEELLFKIDILEEDLNQIICKHNELAEDFNDLQIKHNELVSICQEIVVDNEKLNEEIDIIYTLFKTKDIVIGESDEDNNKNKLAKDKAKSNL